MKLLKELTTCYGPSGNETHIRELIIKNIKEHVDEIQVDVLGNLIARKKGTGKKMMFAAHMDEIGLIVTYIDEKGFIRFSNIGGVSPQRSLYQRVMFENGITGIISYEQKHEDMQKLKLDHLYIDIGAKNKEEAERFVKIGDAACFKGEFICQMNRVISKALDNRIGCYLLIEAIKQIKDHTLDLYFVFTVQEEIGLRGAKTSAFTVYPDYAIAVDVTLTGDTPNAPTMAIEIGKGPAIKIKDAMVITHPIVRKMLEDTAKKHCIPYQYEVLEKGGTDVGAVHITKGGVPSGAISIPTRYVHSTGEVVDMQDVENSIKLITKIIS